MGSGKGEAAESIRKMGFRYISLSDMVREEAAKRGQPVNRHTMQDIGNSLRQSFGAGILGKRVYQMIKSSNYQKWVIDGIRNPAEVKELKKLKKFYLLGIESDMEIILCRLISRQRSMDQADQTELEQRLSREWGTGEPKDGQQVGKCMEMCDFRLTNNQSIQEFHQSIQELIRNYSQDL